MTVRTEQNISKAVDYWQFRLKAVVQVDGGHTEQLLTWLLYAAVTWI